MTIDQTAVPPAFALSPGFAIGHWTNADAATGCTVVLCPAGTVGGADVRGNSPGSRELALLGSEKSMQEVHAVILTGGSAYGLAAADGVMRFLEERGVGYRTPWGIVPIVPGAVIFDLNVGSSSTRPGSAEGYLACLAANDHATGQGSIGAGTGATVGKWGGMEGWMKGGLGVAGFRSGDLHVAAVAVVNAVGDVLDERGGVLAGARLPSGAWRADTDPLRRMLIERPPLPQIGNTTLVTILCNCRMSKVDANRVAQRGHDGLARAIQPVHTMFDGDVVFALSGGSELQPLDVVAELGAAAAAAAVRSAVRHAVSIHGVPALGGLAP